MTDYPDSEFQEAVQDEIARRKQKQLYDAITQAYFQDERSEFQSVDINDHPLLKIAFYCLDDACQLSEEEGMPINLAMDTMMQEEINALQRIQRVFE